MHTRRSTAINGQSDKKYDAFNICVYDSINRYSIPVSAAGSAIFIGYQSYETKIGPR